MEYYPLPNEKSPRRKKVSAGRRLTDRLDGDIFKAPYRSLTHDRPLKASNEGKALCDEVWPRVATLLGNRKLEAKKGFLLTLLENLLLARDAGPDVCLAYSRNTATTPEIHLKVIDAMATLGLITNHKSKQGGKHMSRITATATLGIVPQPRKRRGKARVFVVMKSREDKKNIPFDASHPVAVEYREALLKINRVLSFAKISYRPHIVVLGKQKFDQRIEIIPSYQVVFTDDFEQHGRLYDRYQKLTPVERTTVQFDGEVTTELDFSACHIRMLYHLAGIDYKDDPYSFLYDEKGSRELAKLLVNTSLNARSRSKAINACSFAILNKDKKGKSKEKAMTLYGAWKEQGKPDWDSMYDDMLDEHAGIADQFSSDIGMKLMRHEGHIALNVLLRFADAGLPCLNVHDSFIARREDKGRLRAWMAECYHQELGYNPIIREC